MAKGDQKEKSFHRELLQQLVTLSTSGFGLVAALAWNEAIQTFVKEYIQQWFPDETGISGIIAKFIYAIIITTFAVLVTYQLSRLASRFNSK